jgi:inosine-uridine nucleoside N-ribohydrolase
LQLAGLDVPRPRRGRAPLCTEAKHAPDIHGESARRPVRAELTRQVAGHDAVRFIVDTVRRLDNVWLVAVGPLTNVALPLRAAPDIAGRLAGSPSWAGARPSEPHDGRRVQHLGRPEAAQIVFGSGVRLVMCGLNVTHQFMISGADVARIRALETRSRRLPPTLEFYAKPTPTPFWCRARRPAAATPCAVLAVTHPHPAENRTAPC